MADTRLGWKKATKHAETIVSKGNLTREQQLEAMRELLESRHQQDHRLAMALLVQLIKAHPKDFDREISLDNLIEYGKTMAKVYWKNFGKHVLYRVLMARSVPAVWIDRIADEESKELRQAFAVAIEELAKRKTVPLDRTLGIARYFLDDPSPEARERIARALMEIGKRDPERLHYFLVQHQEGAGTDRMALMADVRKGMGW